MNSSWLAIDTPDISRVPSLPIMILSRRLTKFVTALCSMIGTAMASTMA